MGVNIDLNVMGYIRVNKGLDQGLISVYVRVNITVNVGVSNVNIRGNT